MANVGLLVYFFGPNKIMGKKNFHVSYSWYKSSAKAMLRHAIIIIITRWILKRLRRLQQNSCCPQNSRQTLATKTKTKTLFKFARENILGFITHMHMTGLPKWYLIIYIGWSSKENEAIMCRNDELSWMMSISCCPQNSRQTLATKTKTKTLFKFARENILGFITHMHMTSLPKWYLIIYIGWSSKANVTNMCRNDELSATMSWVGCLLKYSELFILFAENCTLKRFKWHNFGWSFPSITSASTAELYLLNRHLMIMVCSLISAT